MQPHMLPDEIKLFSALLARADRYLEFGSGGSTCLAASIVKTSITSVDSSKEWLDKVGAACAEHPEWLKPRLFHVDIGPIGDWGAPTDPSTKDRWPDYHTKVWSEPGSADGDLYMVDGRFRVACFLQTLLHCRRDAVICFHDFPQARGEARPRGDYIKVREVAREIAAADNFAAFVQRHDMDRERVQALLHQHALSTT